MNQKYTLIVEKISQILFEEIITKEENLADKILILDRELLSLLRAIGLQVMSMLLKFSIKQVISKIDLADCKIKRRPPIKYTTIFGEFKIDSPYIWNQELKKGIRPVSKFLGITAGSQSLAVIRALTDFGIEESFKEASSRFQEHYGFKFERNKIRRITLKVAEKAVDFIENKLKNVLATSECDRTKKTEILLLELDGCQIRTGLKTPINKDELTKIRKIKKSSRKIDWREVRIAFARPFDQKEEKTFVGLMDKYPKIIQQLRAAAYDRGLYSESKIFAIGDGANGLFEAFKNAFPGLQYILDHSHLKKHLYTGIDALELPQIWVNKAKEHFLNLIHHGKVEIVIGKLEKSRQKKTKEINNLIKYLTRFKDCVDYQRFKYLGLPIGSGEVESSHKYIPQKRLKIAGATWHPETINPMLTLRIIKANNWWHEFWNKFTHLSDLQIENIDNNSNLNLAT